MAGEPRTPSPLPRLLKPGDRDGLIGWQTARIEELERENEKLLDALESLIDDVKSHASDFRSYVDDTLDDHERKMKEIVEKAEEARG